MLEAKLKSVVKFGTWLFWAHWVVTSMRIKQCPLWCYIWRSSRRGKAECVGSWDSTEWRGKKGMERRSVVFWSGVCPVCSLREASWHHLPKPSHVHKQLGVLCHKLQQSPGTLRATAFPLLFLFLTTWLTLVFQSTDLTISRQQLRNVFVFISGSREQNITG